MICSRISKQSNHNRLSVSCSDRSIQNKFKYYDENDDDEERYTFNSVGRKIIRDWCSTAAPPFFFNITIFLASRKSQDDFPSDSDEESDEDSFDDETR